jgi:hypothetical protein
MRYVCAAIALFALVGCDTYVPPPPPPPPVTATTTVPPSTAVVPSANCIYTSRSYPAGTRISPPELPGTMLQCVNGSWHSI